MLNSQLKENCLKIYEKYEEKNLTFDSNKKNSSANKYKDDTDKYNKTKSTNFMTYDCEINLKKKEKNESDSSSSEEEEDNKYARSLSKFDDNIGELIKKDFGYPIN
jgi:hypothetical protein